MKNRVYVVSIAVLLLFSLLVYAAQLLLFRDVRTTEFYFFQDLAFLPISIILVTYIIDQTVSRRQRRQTLEKMNYIVGVFYSELGKTLLSLLGDMHPGIDGLKQIFSSTDDWSGPALERVRARLLAYDHAVVFPGPDAVDRLRDVLRAKRSFMVGLLENPNLLEHETFTDLLMATFHLTEELTERGHTADIAPDDWQHIENDARRVYGYLVMDWLRYLTHLHKNYPYLFKFAAATNPLKK